MLLYFISTYTVSMLVASAWGTLLPSVWWCRLIWLCCGLMVIMFILLVFHQKQLRCYVSQTSTTTVS